MATPCISRMDYRRVTLFHKYTIFLTTPFPQILATIVTTSHAISEVQSLWRMMSFQTQVACMIYTKCLRHRTHKCFLYQYTRNIHICSRWKSRVGWTSTRKCHARLWSSGAIQILPNSSDNTMNVLISDTEIQNVADGAGLYFNSYYTSVDYQVTLQDVSVSDAETGIYAYYADISANNVTIENTDSYGLNLPTVLLKDRISIFQTVAGME